MDRWLAARGAGTPRFAVDPGRRDPLGARPRPIRHHPQRRAAGPQHLEYGLRRVPLALALFPAWGGDCDSDLDPCAFVQRAPRKIEKNPLIPAKAGIQTDLELVV